MFKDPPQCPDPLTGGSKKILARHLGPAGVPRRPNVAVPWLVLPFIAGLRQTAIDVSPIE